MTIDRADVLVAQRNTIEHPDVARARAEGLAELVDELRTEIEELKKNRRTMEVEREALP